jgi:hypothetical protein
MARRLIGGKADRERDRLEAALLRLELDPVAIAPQIGLLTNIFREARVKLPFVIETMRASSEPMIRGFLKNYDAVSAQDRKVLPFEAYAVKSGLDLAHLLGVLLMAIRERSAPTVKSALKQSGYRDRQMLHQALGFLATPKGQTINVNLPGFPGPEDGAEDKLIPPEEIDMNEAFPDLMVTQAKLIPPCEPEEK